MKISATAVLYSRRKKSNGKYPVKLKVIFNREKKFYSTSVDLTEEEFKKLHLDRSLLKDYKKVSYYITKANKVIESLQDNFSFSEFEQKFLTKVEKSKASNNNIIDAISAYKNMLVKEGRFKSENTYQGTLNWLQKYSSRKSIAWETVDVSFLKSLDEFMRKNGLSDSTIGIYLRNIRTVFNKAISDKIIRQELYPFGRNRYTPPASRNIKKALSLEEIKKLYNYTPENKQEAWAKDLWFFSYFANGLNMKDICLLKVSNMASDEILFVRQKTKNSRKLNQLKVSILLTDELNAILERRTRDSKAPSDYLFDIVPPNATDEDIYKIVNQTIKTVNKYMTRIAEKLKLKRSPTTNFARHSYSTVLKRAGVPIEMISESLGHSSIRTTQIYLDSFEKEQKLEAIKHLSAFKNEV